MDAHLDGVLAVGTLEALVRAVGVQPRVEAARAVELRDGHHTDVHRPPEVSKHVHLGEAVRPNHAAWRVVRVHRL